MSVNKYYAVKEKKINFISTTCNVHHDHCPMSQACRVYVLFIENWKSAMSDTGPDMWY